MKKIIFTLSTVLMLSSCVIKPSETSSTDVTVVPRNDTDYINLNKGQKLISVSFRTISNSSVPMCLVRNMSATDIAETYWCYSTDMGGIYTKIKEQK